MRWWLGWVMMLAACVPTRAPVDPVDAGSVDAAGDAAAILGADGAAGDAGALPDSAGAVDSGSALLDVSDSDLPTADDATATTDADASATADAAEADMVQDAIADALSDADEADVVQLDEMTMDTQVPDVGASDAGGPPDVAGFPDDVGFAPAPDAKPLPLGTSYVYKKTEEGGYALAQWATSTDVVGIDYSCPDPSKYVLPACQPGVQEDSVSLGALHIFPPTAITYTDAPPSAGNHRPEWGLYGEYAFMPPQRWLHNLEHGSVALLYHPCAPKSLVESLRAFGKAQKPQPGEAEFRQVMSPYPNLKHAIAMVTWGHIYYADCVQPKAMEAWLLEHYNKAAEDMAGSGSYMDLWLGPLKP